MGCIAVAARMRDIIKLKTPNLNELDARAREGMAYLLYQLDSIEIDEETLRRWSYERAREERHHYKRTDAIEAAGWPSF